MLHNQRNMYNHDMLLTKTYLKNASLFPVIQRYFSKFYRNILNTSELEIIDKRQKLQL